MPALSGPAGGGEDAQKQDIVLPVEEIAMQRKTSREENPYL